MHNCAFCRNPLQPLNAWKAAEGEFYCNEFCADAADDTARIAARHQFKFEAQPRQAA